MPVHRFTGARANTACVDEVGTTVGAGDVRKVWMVRVVSIPDHPSADLSGALDEALWEALVAAATKNALAAPLTTATAAKLASMGLLQGGSRSTAAGYARLLHWHRKHRRSRRLGEGCWICPGGKPARHPHALALGMLGPIRFI